MRVLVVEDAIAVRNMLEDFLGLYGYDVLVASHPDTAFKRLKGISPQQYRIRAT